jgi:hypothetical protein
LLADADATVATAVKELRLARLDDSLEGARRLLTWIEGSPGRSTELVRDALGTLVKEYKRH